MPLAMALFQYNKIAAYPTKPTASHIKDINNCAILRAQKTVRKTPRNFPALL